MATAIVMPLAARCRSCARVGLLARHLHKLHRMRLAEGGAEHRVAQMGDILSLVEEFEESLAEYLTESRERTVAGLVRRNGIREQRLHACAKLLRSSMQCPYEFWRHQ